MKRCLTALLALLPLAGLAQARLPLPGETYVAKMGNACAETSTGGCWKSYFYRLRFGRDSVAVSYIVQAVCSRANQAATTWADTTLVQRGAYYLLDQPREVAVPGFQLTPLTLTADGLVYQRPPAEGGGQVVFELEAVTRP